MELVFYGSLNSQNTGYGAWKELSGAEGCVLHPESSSAPCYKWLR